MSELKHYLLNMSIEVVGFSTTLSFGSIDLPGYLHQHRCISLRRSQGVDSSSIAALVRPPRDVQR